MDENDILFMKSQYHGLHVRGSCQINLQLWQIRGSKKKKGEIIHRGPIANPLH